MASISRSASPFMQSTAQLCRQCRRSFASTAQAYSGHNKWSKIKHTKGAEDAKKNAMRSQFSKTLTMYSRLYGANPDNNPALATTIAAAKKAGVPKNTLEQAIARGQGRSTTGASLESITFEVMMPPSVALMLDVETDNRLRSLQDLNQIVKKHKGRTASTEFFFSRLGRVVFEKKDGVGIDEIMDEAIEAGAEDLEADDEGNIMVWTQPSQTMQIAQSVGKRFDLKVLNSEIIWSANEGTQAQIDSMDDLKKLADLVAALQDFPDVQAVYSNASRGNVPEEEWAKLEDNLDM